MNTRMIFATGLALGACSTATELVPVDPTPGPVQHAVVRAVSGIRVGVQGGSWPGDPRIQKHVTPLRVTVVNRGDRPVEVRYEAFSLVSGRGKIYSALPPYEVRGSIERPVVAYLDEPIYDPWFRHDRFGLAPYYAGIYPGMPLWNGGFAPHFGFYDQYYRGWAKVPLPTPEMLRLALPEGVLRPGGRLSGFLYFERVDRRSEVVALQARWINPIDGSTIGTMMVPFDVEVVRVATR
jgi:hypothetical protein